MATSDTQGQTQQAVRPVDDDLRLRVMELEREVGVLQEALGNVMLQRNSYCDDQRQMAGLLDHSAERFELLTNTIKNLNDNEIMRQKDMCDVIHTVGAASGGIVERLIGHFKATLMDLIDKLEEAGVCKDIECPLSLDSLLRPHAKLLVGSDGISYVDTPQVRAMLKRYPNPSTGIEQTAAVQRNYTAEAMRDLLVTRNNKINVVALECEAAMATSNAIALEQHELLFKHTLSAIVTEEDEKDPLIECHRLLLEIIPSDCCVIRPSNLKEKIARYAKVLAETTPTREGHITRVCALDKMYDRISTALGVLKESIKVPDGGTIEREQADVHDKQGKAQKKTRKKKTKKRS